MLVMGLVVVVVMAGFKEATLFGYGDYSEGNTC